MNTKEGEEMVNKSHPDFQKYQEAFSALTQAMKQEEAEIDTHKDRGQLGRIHKRYHQKISALQKQYAHLYE